MDYRKKAHSALDEGKLARALDLLHLAVRQERGRERRAELLLELAAAYLLAGDEYLELGMAALERAEQSRPGLKSEPLGRVLHAELQALNGAPTTEVLHRLESLGGSGDHRVHFHAASAYLLVGEPQAALEHLQRAQDAALPRHLLWRSWSLTGVALEQLDDFELAARSIRQAVALSPEGEQQELERLALADCLLELGDAQAAATELAVIRQAKLTREEDQVFRIWLQARAEQQLGNPGLAIQHFRQARTRSLAGALIPPGSPFDLYGLTLAEAQLLADIGSYDESLASYTAALGLVSEEQSSLTRHEYAVVLIEAGKSQEANLELRKVAADSDYEWRAEVLAELADLAFREGDNREAERLANEALALRPVATAYLCLGSIAFEYYRLSEAVSWFELAAGTATDGDPGWVAAQQLLADVFAQMGPDNADRLYLHAQAALKYTDARNDWYLPLRNHAENARRALAGQRRLVN